VQSGTDVVVVAGEAGWAQFSSRLEHDGATKTRGNSDVDLRAAAGVE
jgi:hypothetical protein